MKRTNLEIYEQAFGVMECHDSSFWLRDEDVVITLETKFSKDEIENMRKVLEEADSIQSKVYNTVLEILEEEEGK